MTSSLRLMFATKAAFLCSFLALIAPRASAQDPTPGSRAPNVLLLVDTSGSMEYEAGVKPSEADAPMVCDPTGAIVSERSRWADVVEVLSGTITNYRCQAVDRSSSTFTGLYDLPSSQRTPDYQYRNNHHRLLSGTCAPTPNTTALTTNGYEFVAPNFSVYNSTTSCTFGQSPDGLIDSLGASVRFGLMTFDTVLDKGTGVLATSPYTPNYSTGSAGAWSYYFGASATGRPNLCTTPPTDVEVGVRNGAAPAWEGKLIHFGDPDATSSDDAVRNTRIEQVLLSTRPFGATPIAGALTDAQSFLTLDTSADPTPTSDVLHSTYYGPSQDPYVVGGCREQYVVLLTDGEPNLDLRPHCEGSGGGVCPFDTSADVAAELSGLASPIKTYVVGFADAAAPAPDSVDCTTMTAADWATGGVCTQSSITEELRTCCTLNELAYEGGTTKAYFGNDKAALRSQLSAVFNQIVAASGSATQPVRTPGKGAADATSAVAYRLLTSFETAGSGVWRGNIERLRWTCSSAAVPTEAAKDASLGDDFSFNVNKNPTARTLVTYLPTAASSVVYSDRSVRPNISTTNGALDNIGTNAGAQMSGSPSTFVTNLTSGALKAPCSGSVCAAPCADLTTASACQTRLAKWFVGLTDDLGRSRCATAASSPTDTGCSVIGDVLHSTPLVVNRPTAEIEDEGYAAFATSWTGRPMMAYTSSNDGVLHGFKVSPNVSTDASITDTTNNEKFGLVPPAILPLIGSEYPSSRQKLLDGVPIVADVVATANSTNTHYPFLLERSGSSAQNATSTFRTILLQSFGGANAGYFAVDITDPTVPSSGNGGPRFLWQLTTDSSGNPLFGEQAATPIITTLNISGVETAVAVLPGGSGSVSTGACTRGVTSYTTIETGYSPRSQVRCYNLDKDNDGVIDSGDAVTNIGARSLTIVRLDSGEVIRRFRRSNSEGPAMTGKGLLASLDSPITGTPAAYPSGPGAVSDRIFVGDQDGGLWRVDTSSSAPSSWTMTLFFDTFAKHPDIAVPATAAAAGRAIVLPPTLSVDQLGQLTIAVATGDQDVSGASGEENYVWSLKEAFNSAATGYTTAVNWYSELADGEHTLGRLQLVESVLYYSTYKPTLGAACGGGSSSVFGVSYLVPFNASALSAGGQGALRVLGAGTTVQSRTATQLGLPTGTLIFGVALEYQPTCYTDPSITNPVLGGRHGSATAASASKLQLSFQTGTTDTSKVALGFKTGFETVALEAPRSSATIESWAAILE